MDDQSHKYYKTPGCQDSSLRRTGGEGPFFKKSPRPSRESSRGGSNKIMCLLLCMLLHLAVFRPRVCCHPTELSVRASVQFEVDEGDGRCRLVQAAAAVRRGGNGRYLLLTCSPHTITGLCGGNLCLRHVSPLPPYSLLLLPALSVVSVCYSVSIVSQRHTHTHLTQQFISILNLCSER